MTAPERISVIVCAYTEDRWQDLLDAIRSLQNQTCPADQLILVIDHNQALYERAGKTFENITLIESRDDRGLSGARNSGLAVASGEIVAFMDEDARADPDWLEKLVAGFERTDILGVGGAIQPAWDGGRPGWFPEEFDWVVGCTYRGMPAGAAPVRNLIGCNMAFRRSVFEAVGGFRNGIGRIGTLPVGCEETELCIRARQHWRDGTFLYEPAAGVQHHVTQKRASFNYFVRRCYAEGLSKALVASLVGAQDGLSSEKSYTLRTLPKGIVKGVADAIRLRQAPGLARAGMILVGLASTTLGYLKGRLTLARQKLDGSKRSVLFPGMVRAAVHRATQQAETAK